MSTSTKVSSTLLTWPARAYCYGTWGYALSRAVELTGLYQRKAYCYAGTLDGEAVWVVALDPKER